MPARRRSWPVLLAAFLLLVPLALSAHVHAAHQGKDCAVCVVSHHTPTVRTTTPTLSAPIVVPSQLIAPAVLVPTSAERPVHAGRGPPTLLASTPS